MEPADLLGPAAASHIPVIVEILDGLDEHTCEFMADDHFLPLAKDDWLEGQRIYWLEILYRAHFAASTTVSTKVTEDDYALTAHLTGRSAGRRVDL
jgi:hypothetical protein